MDERSAVTRAKILWTFTSLYRSYCDAGDDTHPLNFSEDARVFSDLHIHEPLGRGALGEILHLTATALGINESQILARAKAIYEKFDFSQDIKVREILDVYVEQAKAQGLFKSDNNHRLS